MSESIKNYCFLINFPAHRSNGRQGVLSHKVFLKMIVHLEVNIFHVYCCFLLVWNHLSGKLSIYFELIEYCRVYMLFGSFDMCSFDICPLQFTLRPNLVYLFWVIFILLFVSVLSNLSTTQYRHNQEIKLKHHRDIYRMNYLTSFFFTYDSHPQLFVSSILVI